MRQVMVLVQGYLLDPPGGGGGGGGGGQPPLGIWGGSGVGDYIDAGFPGPQPGQPPRPWGPINYPDQGLPGNQPGLWPIRPPYVDIGFPGPQPGQPPRPWGPINYPDQGLPQPQPPTRPPGVPTHPIYYPPVIWDPSRPSNPITNPGDPNNPGAGQPGGGGGGEQPLIEWKTAWSPSTGWIVVGVPTGEHPTPSGQSQGEDQQPQTPSV